MRVIDPSYEILDRRQLTTAQKIEYAGRTAYKSENKITEDSSFEFLQKMINNEHFPVLEFSNVHVFLEFGMPQDKVDELIVNFVGNADLLKYFALSAHYGDTKSPMILSGTVRAFMEMVYKTVHRADNDPVFKSIVNTLNKHTDIFPLSVCNHKGDLITYDIEENITSELVSSDFIREAITNERHLEKHLMCAVKFICNRAVTHELVRHRPVTIIQESQRYCRYSLAKFGNEVTFIKPSAFFPCPGDFPNEPHFDDKYTEYYLWEKACITAEEIYFLLLNKGNSPQAARTVLPNSCKTEIIIYATIEEWRHIFKMRVPATAEPSMRQLTVPLEGEFFNEDNKLKWE